MPPSATVRVEKATSDLLIGPDWTMNIDICDSININHWEAKDVVKAVKKRLQHKNPKVQLLALTLLETMLKNCGDYVHFQIAERHILQEMSKIVKKKTDMHVRDKILVLLDSWQEAFGGPGGKHTQYYWAYEELRRSGITFPPRSADAAPIFTPPATNPSHRDAQVGYGMPTHSAKRLDEAMASEIGNLSLSGLDSMRNVMELLADMLQTVNPNDHLAVKDELIVDLAGQCRANQKKLMQMLTSTGDEDLLGRGLELNDSLQSLLAKYEAISSGSPLPSRDISSPQQNGVGPSSLKSPEVGEARAIPNPTISAPVNSVTKVEAEEEEEEEDDFDQLARRHSKAHVMPSPGATNGTSESTASENGSAPTLLTANNALALPDPPAPVNTTKELDMIDLLSLTLSTASTSPHTPSTSSQTMHHQVPVPSTSAQSSPYASMNHPGNLGPVTYNSYVVPWAQPQTPPQQQPQPQPQPRPQTISQPQPQPQTLSQTQPQSLPLPQPQSQAPFHYPQNSYGYPPPPWVPTLSYYGSQNPSSNANMFSTPRASASPSYAPTNAARPLQHLSSFPSKGISGSSVHENARVNPSPGSPAPVQKPFVPSYRLFEDLNVLGNADGRVKGSGGSSSSSSLSMLGSSGQGMVARKK